MTNSNSLLRIFSAVLACCLVNPCDAQTQTAQEWTEFLGADRTSEAADAAPITKWDSSNYIWEAELPGLGWSSPVYADNKIWLTTAEVQEADPEKIKEKRKGVQFSEMKTTAGSMELKAVCVALDTGEILHDISLAKVSDPELINPMNSYASPTAAIADGKVVCHFGNYGTWCLNATTGEPIWDTKYVVDHSVGPGSSPVIYQDKVILVCDGIDQQFVAAVSLSDGEEVWKTARPPMRNKNGEYQKAYSTPLMIEVGGKPQAVIPVAQWIVSYNPNTGEEIWRVDHGEGFSLTPTPSFEDGMVVFSTGFMRPEVLGIDPTGSGDVTQSHVKWRAKNGPDMPSFLTFDGKAYFLSGKGILNCADVATGEIVNRARIGGNYSATPLMSGGNIYLSSREGKVTVVKADSTLEIISTNKFEGQILATPAPVGDDLIFRVGEKLYRIGKKSAG